jgi:ribokinase
MAAPATWPTSAAVFVSRSNPGKTNSSKTGLVSSPVFLCPEKTMARPVLPRVLLLGSSNTDLVVSCDRLPSPGETLLGGEFRRFQGGKGANQAVAAARAGARVVFIGACGADDFGKNAAAALRRERIDLRHFTVREGCSSGVALILLGGRSRENIIAVARSANDGISAADVRKAGPEFARSDVVVSQLEVPLVAVREAARLARTARVPFLLNPAPARKLPRDLLKLVHTLTPNEHEAALLTGKSDPAAAGQALVQSGSRQVVITLGARGALLVNAEGAMRFAAPKVRPVDTVGAGDCFTGWLAVGMAEGLPIREAIVRALKAASLSVTRAGAQASMPLRSEVVD